MYFRESIRMCIHTYIRTRIIFVLMFCLSLRMFFTIHLFQEIESVFMFCFDITPKARNIFSNKTFTRN